MLVYEGRSSCQQLNNDSIQKRKASLVIVIAPETKYPRSIMNDIKLCLATNWWQLWLHWRQEQSAEWLRQFNEGGPSGCTVWENTLRTVLVAIQESKPTLEAGGNTRPGSPFLPDEPYRYRNWAYRYRNWPYRHTDYSMPFAVNRSLSASMQSRTRIEYFRFFLPEKPQAIHFL